MMMLAVRLNDQFGTLRLGQSWNQIKAISSQNGIPGWVKFIQVA
jgi:hypothetical protein